MIQAIDEALIIVIVLVVFSITLICQILGRIFAQKLFFVMGKSRLPLDFESCHMSDSYTEVKLLIL